MKLPIRLLPAAAAVVLAGLGPPAHLRAAPAPAASQAPLKLEPIRVTADLWESPLERIAASVTVVDEAALRAGGIRHFGDLADGIPNLTWTGATSRPRYFQIRGIGENSQYEGETPDSSVRFLVDDFDFTGLGTLAGSFDVRQVEVLRGPQAGAFGANAAGGVVRLVTNAPTPFWTGQIEASAGGDDLRAGGFALGGPLDAAHPEKYMLRLALHQSVSDGFRRNVTLNRDTNARDEFMGRLRFTLHPVPHWRWDAAVLFSDVRNGFDEFALDNNGRRTFSDQPGRDEQQATAASLRGAFTGLAGARITSVTTGSRVRSTYSYDDDWTAASYAGFSQLRRTRDVYSQELRADSSHARGGAGPIDRWTAGLFLTRIQETGSYTDEDPGNVRGLQTAYDGRQAAAFAQVAHALAAHNRLIAGVRVERVDLEGRGTRTRFRKARSTFDPVATFQPGFADTLYGGKLTFEHDLSEREIVFASVARGYKAGGINVDARISPPADPLTYATEGLWNTEAGVRGNWFGRRLTGELTAFHLRRRDTQVRDSAGFGGSYRFFTANAQRARVYGLEAAAGFALTREWSIHGTLATMESSLDRFVLANGNAGGGRRLANTPRDGYTLALRRRDDTGWFGQLELVGRSSQFDSNNQNEARRAFQVWNGSIGGHWRGWSLTLWGRNLANTRYEKRVFFFGNADPDYLETRYEDRADPRQIGVTAGYRF